MRSNPGGCLGGEARPGIALADAASSRAVAAEPGCAGGAKSSSLTKASNTCTPRGACLAYHSRQAETEARHIQYLHKAPDHMSCQGNACLGVSAESLQLRALCLQEQPPPAAERRAHRRPRIGVPSRSAAACPSAGVHIHKGLHTPGTKRDEKKGRGSSIKALQATDIGDDKQVANKVITWSTQTGNAALPGSWTWDRQCPQGCSGRMHASAATKANDTYLVTEPITDLASRRCKSCSLPVVQATDTLSASRCTVSIYAT